MTLRADPPPVRRQSVGRRRDTLQRANDDLREFRLFGDNMRAAAAAGTAAASSPEQQ